MSQPAVRQPRLTRHDSFFSDVRRNPFSYLLLLPAMAYVFIFGYMTYPYIVIAFKKFNYQLGPWASPWVGLDNFSFFFKSSVAARVIWNTLYLNILFILTGTIMSLLLAVMLNEIRSKAFVRTTQTMMLLPYYLSWVVVSYMLMAVFSNKNGMANLILKFFGAKGIAWYTRADMWPGILVMMRMWKGAGMNAVIFLAAITGIDESIYEAAVIDGATRFQRIKHVTLPLVMPTVCIINTVFISLASYVAYGGFCTFLHNVSEISGKLNFSASVKSGNLNRKKRAANLRPSKTVNCSYRIFSRYFILGIFFTTKKIRNIIFVNL